PGYMAMGEAGMADHQDHVDAGHMPGPANTLPMMAGKGPFGNIGMGGMFTIIKVRDDLAPGDYRDPGWYAHPAGELARKVSDDPAFGEPVHRAISRPAASREDMPRAHRPHRHRTSRDDGAATGRPGRRSPGATGATPVRIRCRGC